MSNNQRQARSMDGFVTGKSNNRPRVTVKTPSGYTKPPEPTPSPRVTVRKPAYASAPAGAGGASMLNMALPTQNNSSRLRKAEKPKRESWSRKRKLVTSGLVVAVLLVGIVGWFGAGIVSKLDKVFHGNVFSDVHALVSHTTLKGESQGRVNILVAGDSSDDPGHAGADLTDSIMVLSINTKNNTGFLLSVPRDLWVNIPSLGNQKINAANEVTNFSQSGYPSGGMGQLQQIVQTDLGIPIDYEAIINYNAFKDAVNAVGGITVDIQSSDPRGLYDAYAKVKLPNGEDALNGQEALNLARARGDSYPDVSYGFPDTDFDRTMHQRQMVVAITKKAMSAGVLTNPIKVSQLFSALANNLHTDMSLQDVLRLAQITKGINLNNLGSYSYSSTTTGSTKALLMSYTDPDSGQDVLVPTAGPGDFGELQEYYQQLTSSNPVVKEGSSVTILNGSSVVGLAKKEENVLQSKGIDNTTIADAYNEYSGTMIVDNSGGKDPASKALLQKLFPGTVVTSDTGTAEAGEAQGYTSDFVVILGENWNNAQ